MSFIYPSFFWALLFIAIPIAIHLFNFRIYKIVYFSNIKLLQDIKDVSESKSKLKHLILLIIRILTIAALVFAFAEPYIQLIDNQKTDNKKLICIYLDNSFSMSAASKYGNLFDAAKERARKVVSSYDTKEEFLFVTNDFDGRHRIITGKEQVLGFIDEVKPSASFETMSAIMKYVGNYLNNLNDSKNRTVIYYFISDFQKVMADFNNVKTDPATMAYLLPLSTNLVNNIYIDSCWFSTPGRTMNKNESLNVRIVNKGKDEYDDIPVTLFVNSKQKAISNFSIAPNSTIELALNYMNTDYGNLPSFVEITDYPITYDNKFFFSYKVEKQTGVLIINNKTENKYLNLLFSSDSSCFCINTNSGNLRTSEFPKFNVIILDEPETISSGLSDALKNFVLNGGVLVSIPGSNTNLVEYNALLASVQSAVLKMLVDQPSKIDKIYYDHFIYRDVFLKKEEKPQLPALKSYFTALSENNGNELLGSSAGHPLLLQSSFGKGKVYSFLFSLNPENSDFVLNPLFIPTFYNIALYSHAEEKLFYTLGKENIVDLNFKPGAGENIIHIVDLEGKDDFIPQYSGLGDLGIRLNLYNNIKVAGNYFLVENKEKLNCLSFNYDRKESDPQCYTTEEIEKIITENKLFNFKILPVGLNELQAQVIDSLKDKKELWKLFILLALVMLVFEILVIRFWKE
ncbi:MAG: BatA and WFA domain-containing protein [Bacteroidales bacterium]